MRRISDGLARDPLIAAALAARGVDPRDLPQKQRDDEFRLNGTRTLPSILLNDAGEAYISWYDPHHTVSYAVDANGGIVTVDALVMPETLADGLGGRTLSEIVSFPGAEHIRILVAVNSAPFTGEPTNLRMTVERIADDTCPGATSC